MPFLIACCRGCGALSSTWRVRQRCRHAGGNGSGRLPDAYHTIELEERDASRTRPLPCPSQGGARCAVGRWAGERSGVVSRGRRSWRCR
eukprot:gene24583-biopygen10444